MAGTVLQVVESLGGWRLLDDGQPILWFSARDSVIETARVMADARHQFGGKPTYLQAVTIRQVRTAANRFMHYSRLAYPAL